MTFVIFWLCCGALGGDSVSRWYKRNGYQQDTPVLDWVSSLALGPIGLVAAWAAYGF